MDKSHPTVRPERTLTLPICLSMRRSALLAAWAGAAALLALAATFVFTMHLSAASQAPVRQEPPAAAASASLAMTMTAGTQPGACESNAITILAGTPLYFCYTARNTGSVPFTNHLIADRSLEPGYAAFPAPMPPGATLVYTTPAGSGRPYSADTTVTDIWAANNSPDGTDQAQDEASVQVNVVAPSLQVTATVGNTKGDCADATSMQAPAGGSAQLCIRIRNTGDTPISSLTVSASSSVATGPRLTGTITDHPMLPLAPKAELDILDPAAFAPSLSGKLWITNVQTSFNVSATVRGTTVDGFPVRPPNATAAVKVGKTSVELTPSVNTAAECGPSTPPVVLVGQPFYYCLSIKNTGDVPLTTHAVRSITPTIAVTFTYRLDPQASIAIDNNFLRGLGQPAAMGPFTSTVSLNASFRYTGTNAGGFTAAQTSAAVSVNPATVTPTPLPTWTPTEEPPTLTPWPTAPPTPTWTPPPTPTPTWTPITPSATPTYDWNASFIATPTPDPALQAAAAPDFNATNVAVQQTADAAAFATNTAGGFPPADQGVSPLDTPFFDQSPIDPNATPDLLSVALPVGTATPRATFFMPTATPSPEPTPTSTIRPFAPPPAAAPPGAGLLAANIFDTAVAAIGLFWFAAGTIVFFGAAGIMAAFLGNDARRSRARRRTRAYDLEPEVSTGYTSAFDLEPPAPAAPESSPVPPAAPRARPPAQDDTHWPASLP